MSYQDIIKLLEVIARQHNGPISDGLDLSLAFYKAQDDPATGDPNLSQLLDLLNSEPSLEGIVDHMAVVAGSAQLIEVAMLAGWLVRIALEESPEIAVNYLRQYVESVELPFLASLAVGGIEITNRSPLGGGLEIIPWEQYPDSHEKRTISGLFHPPLAWQRPSAVIVSEEIFEKLNLSSKQHDDYKHVVYSFSRFRDAMLCIGLSGPVAPYALASWLEPPAWGSFTSGGFSLPELIGFPKLKPMVSSTLEDARTLHESFLATDEDFRVVLRLAMERLNSAMLRKSPVDAAIDLGIALEAIFLEDVAGSELVFRLKLRASRFLRDDLDERLVHFRTFGDIYDLRSKAVHTGLVPAEIRGLPSMDLLEKGYSLCAQAISQCIRDGKPDWDVVTLG